jgi:flagellar basal-body rod protein FlgF
MENALLVGLSRQMALARELDVIANNVANIGTTGFKARSLKFEEYLMPKASADAFPTVDKSVSFVVDKGTGLDFTAGAVERTGNPLDVAIRGDNLLTVRTPQGERYTRNGSLQINARGELVTSDGYPVVGDAGPITFTGTEKFTAIGPDGTVSTNDGPKGRLKLVSVPNPRLLNNDGANLYATEAPLPPAGREVRIETGAIERSNVKPIVEMSRLIEVNRSYASVASMIQKTDELRRSAIERLASVPA